MTRRHFLKSTTAAVATLDSYATPILPALATTSGRQSVSPLLLFATNWGFAGSIEAFCEKAKAAGYDGIEVWWSHDPSVSNALFTALKKHGLAVGFLVGDGSSDYAKNLDNFSKALEAAATNTNQKPAYINCHSGKDYFSFEQNLAFMDASQNVSKRTGITVCHETHRGRILYNAPLTRQFIEKRPDLRLTLDISHWCCVHESLLGDQAETVALALNRTEHIHARVGHAEGPQVNDPRAPEWAKAVEAHFGWWDKIVTRKRQANEAVTILTEFGPPDYLPALPYTRQAVANQWDINVHMMQTLHKRYA
jgi:sugar phosphate isomerase/epimerase